LFWNEIFLDVERVPEFSSCPEAQKLFSSEGFQTRLQQAQGDPLIRYPEVYSLKKNILLLLLKEFLRHSSPHREEFHRFVKNHPLLESYARSQDRKDGALETPPAEPYHQWVQWLAETQLHEAAREAKDRGMRISLDYPLGVSGEGFECRAFSDIFVRGISVGAPPDPFFSEGQNWDFLRSTPKNSRRL
jgi:4-alpha-glucanotransferase